MATLNFPLNPYDGEIYPSTPAVGQKAYKWSASYQTWLLMGTATGVDADTYGSASSVPRFTVDVSGRITFAENVGIAVDAGNIEVNPEINGFNDVQSVLESAIYNVDSPNLSVIRSFSGDVTITLPNTTVTPGTYTYATFTVDPQGRIISATPGTPTAVDVTSPIIDTGTPSNPVIGILPSSTSQSGAVQLNDTVSSTATNLALTAAQGLILQQQIKALTIAGNLSYAGTFDPSTSQMVTVTVNGSLAGFRVGFNIPAPSSTVIDHFVIISVPGVYTPPGSSSPLTLVHGDWLFCNGTNWVKVNIGNTLPYASTTAAGAVELSTNEETQEGTDATKAVTPASLSSRIATEDKAGIAEVATQAEVDSGADDSRFVTPLKLSNYISGGLNNGIPATKVVADPIINGKFIVQDLLEDAIYDVKSSNLSVTEAATGNITVNLPNTGVSPGSYTYTSITVDPVGRVTAAASGTPPLTNVVSPIVNTGTTVQPVVGILASSTSQSGAVQLEDSLSSNATNFALTAAQGKVLQDQIRVLSLAGNLSFSGTFNADLGQMVTVTVDGEDAGFTVGADIPFPSTLVRDHFVIITTPGTYTPPGGTTPLDLGQGAWLFCNGTEWVKVDLASKVPSASETSRGIIRLATTAETQTGTDATPAVTPFTLSSRTATETRTGLAEIATQAEVDTGADDTKFVTPLKFKTTLDNGNFTLPASNTIVNPDINGNTDVQSVLEDAIYNVSSSNLTVTEAATGLVGIDLPNTGVTPGSYTYASISVDPQGRITTASSTSLPVASTTQAGIVQLVDNATTNSNTQALTASVGVDLQQQIDVIYDRQYAAFAGTLDASTGLVVAVTAEGQAAGFASNSPLPNPSATNASYFVIVVVPGIYAPPLGGSVDANDGDWFVSNGSQWTYWNVGAGSVDAASVTLLPPVHGNTNVQGALEDAIYEITAVTPVAIAGTSLTPEISVLNSTTTSSGVVQLNDTRTTNSSTLALTAAQGKILQDQINVLTIAGNLAYSGTFNASTGVMDSVTVVGTNAGFVVGQNIPAPSVAVTDHFVIITVGGTYTPPGGTVPFNLDHGDWLFCNGTDWVQVQLGNRLPLATTTVPGAVELSTNAETQAGTDSTLAVTPASLSSRTATETRTGIAEIATQAEVNAGANDSRFVTPLKLSSYVSGGGAAPPASSVTLSPSVHGNTNVQDALEDAIYDITVVAPVTKAGTSLTPEIGVLNSTTTRSGVVQLNDTRTTNSSTLALTAAQGKILQDQINVLTIAGNLAYSGTFDASTGLMETVTVVGTNAGFVVGQNIPAPSVPVTDHFVIVTIGGTYTPPGGGGPFNLDHGDWLFCNGTNWVQVQLGDRLPLASTTSPGAVELSTNAETQAGTDATLAVTPASLSSRTATETRTGLAEIATQAEVNAGADDSRIVTPLKLANYISGGGGGVYHYAQLDDISSGFNGANTSFSLTISSIAYTPTPSGNLMVFLGGIAQIPGDAYTVSGSTITFSDPPPASASFYATTVVST